MSTYDRNAAVYAVILGLYFASLPALADPSCYDGSLKALDRLKLRLETNISLSAEELRCRAIKGSAERYQSEDEKYHDQRSDDKVFRDSQEITESQRITTYVDGNISVSTYQSKDAKPKSQPLKTVKGYKSVVREP